jgi:hypothetical protein
MRVLDRVAAKYLRDRYVVEVACAEGVLTADILSKYASHIDAYDISEKAIARATKLGLPNVTFSVSDFVGYDYPSSCEAVLLLECLYYVSPEEQAQALSRIRNIPAGQTKAAQPGNRILFFSCPIIDKLDPVAGKLGRKYYTYAEAAALMEKSGFTIIEEHNLNMRNGGGIVFSFPSRCFAALFRFVPISLIDLVPKSLIYQRLFVCKF